MTEGVAIYETDVQYDFSFRDGKLFVYGFEDWNASTYGAESRLPNILSIHEKAKEKGWLITGSVDRHFYEDAELIRNKGGIFIDHCMNGTKGQLRWDRLEPQKDVYVRAKDGPQLGVRNCTDEELERYLESGVHVIFEKQNYDIGTNPNFNRALRMMLGKGVRKFVVNGFATDYCVEAALNRMVEFRDESGSDIKLYVVSDAICPVNIDFKGQKDMEFGKKALERLVSKGVKLVTTKQVLEGKLE